MLIYPAIDLYEGKAVRLLKGDYAQMTVYSENPAGVAADFSTCGAKQIHLVDLEGAKTGETPNLETILNIKKQTGLFCEVGGGIRTMQTVMMCAIATPSATACYAEAENKDIPVIFTAITDPEAAGLTGGNVTGTSDKLPVEAQLELIRAMKTELPTMDGGDTVLRAYDRGDHHEPWADPDRDHQPLLPEGKPEFPYLSRYCNCYRRRDCFRMVRLQRRRKQFRSGMYPRFDGADRFLAGGTVLHLRG